MECLQALRHVYDSLTEWSGILIITACQAAHSVVDKGGTYWPCSWTSERSVDQDPPRDINTASATSPHKGNNLITASPSCKAQEENHRRPCRELDGKGQQLMIKQLNFYGFAEKGNWSPESTLKILFTICSVFWRKFTTLQSNILPFWYLSVINLKREVTSSLLRYLTASSSACGCISLSWTSCTITRMSFFSWHSTST